MKTLADIEKLLKKFDNKFALNSTDAAQQSEIWYQLKLGVISASNASKVVAGKTTDTRLSYMCELVAQVCTGNMEEINTKYTDWGNQNEAAARSTYEMDRGSSISPVLFIFKDESFRAGCSPDGIVTDLGRGVEIKCPFNSAHFIKFLTEDKIKPEYHWQTQFTLWTADADEWDFMQYDPRMKTIPYKIMPIKKDLEAHKKLDDMVPEFISDMDAMLAKCGVKFGEQWTRLAERPF